jgi:hypothetical protein
VGAPTSLCPARVHVIEPGAGWTSLVHLIGGLTVLIGAYWWLSVRVRDALYKDAKFEEAIEQYSRTLDRIPDKASELAIKVYANRSVGTHSSCVPHQFLGSSCVPHQVMVVINRPGLRPRHQGLRQPVSPSVLCPAPTWQDTRVPNQVHDLRPSQR